MNALEISQTYLQSLNDLLDLSLPNENYLIWESGPLAIRGVREARDIDLLVTKDLWKQLAAIYPVQGENIFCVTV